MTKKRRRHMRVTLTLSVLIAAVPLSLAFIFNNGEEPRISLDLLQKKEQPAAKPLETGKILPILANK